MNSSKTLLRILKQGLLFVLFMGSAGIANAALNFSFTAADQGSRPGERFQVEWIVVNDGSNTENNVSVEVPMPNSGIATISDSLTDGGDCPSINCEAGETILWSLGSIPAGESRTAGFALQVLGSAANGGIPMEGRLMVGSSMVATSTWTQSVSVALVSELTIDSSDAHVTAGTPFSYGFLAGNTGTEPLNNATLSVPVPSSLTIDSAPGGSISGNTVTWNLGNLSSGRVTRRIINVTPASGPGTGDLIVLNDASLSGTVFGVSQSTLADHVVTVGNPPLKFQVRAQETQFKPGEAQNIEFVVSNTTNQVLQNITARLLYPLRLSTISDSQTAGGGCPSINCEPGEQMTWSFGNLLPGETKQVRFRTLAGSGFATGRPVKWQGSVRAGLNVVRRDYLATGNSSVDVNLQIDSDETRVSAGDRYTYTFNVGNVGTGPMDNVALAVPVPQNVTVLETYGGSNVGGVVTWQLSDVASGALKHRYLKVRANNSLAKGSVINLIDAQASSTVFGIPQATMAQHFVTVGDAPIDVEVRLQQTTAVPGESLLMEVVASNTGTQVEQNVTATLLFPDDLAVISDSVMEAGDCPSINCDPGEQFTVPFGNLVPGETKSIAVPMVASASADKGEHATWMGTVSAAGGLSRRFEATLGITDVSAELLISTDELLVVPGANVTYQIAAGNSGASTLSQVSLSVPVPEGMSVVSAPGGSQQNGRIEYNLQDIDEKEILKFELTLAVPSGASNGRQFALENVELSGFMFGIEQMTYGSHVITVGDSPLDGQISVSPEDAKAGEAVQVTIDLANTGSQVEQNVQVFLRYPGGVVVRSESFMDGGECPSINCDPGEGVVWSLGNLIPAETRTISFSTFVAAGQPEGDIIEWAGRVRVGTIKQRRMEAGSLVGTVIVPPPPTETCNGLPVTVFVSLGQSATSGDDVILGTSGADVITAFGGNDTICGMEGPDTILAGNGNDWVDAGKGADEVQGGNGIDTIYGGTGGDDLFGGPDNDIIHGEEGGDTIFGNSGADTIDGGDAMDEIKGGSGNDTIATGPGATVGSGFIVDGGSGNDIITGGDDADEIRGSTGDDTIKGGAGNDRLFGGGGFDDVDGQTGNDFIRGNAADDILQGGTGVDDIDGGTGNDTIRGGADGDTLKGATGNDVIFGESGNDSIVGGGGNDILFGNSGSDNILGGGGNDEMSGGGGAPDTCNGQGGAADTATSSCEVVINVP